MCGAKASAVSKQDEACGRGSFKTREEEKEKEGAEAEERLRRVDRGVGVRMRRRWRSPLFFVRF